MCKPYTEYLKAPVQKSTKMIENPHQFDQFNEPYNYYNYRYNVVYVTWPSFVLTDRGIILISISANEGHVTRYNAVLAMSRAYNSVMQTPQYYILYTSIFLADGITYCIYLYRATITNIIRIITPASTPITISSKYMNRK